MSSSKQTISSAVDNLQVAYGAPSQSAFGSAVFHDALPPAEDLEQAALAKYRHFTGDLWERYGEDAWMGPWKVVYARQPGAKHDIVSELRGIQDREAALSAPMILDVDPAALSAVFDDAAMGEVRVYNLGDGAAMSGLLVAGRWNVTDEATFLVFLMD